ncbi:subtilisin-like serine protease [Ceratobasidium sp. 395]|nr:subtilisin-like serine protease [Ceratobasidium sp. 395]
MIFTVALSAFFLVAPVVGVPALVPITKRAGPVKPDSYIVMFKNHEYKNKFMSAGSQFTHPHSGLEACWDIIPGCSVNVLSLIDVHILRGLLGIESIEHNGIVSLEYEQGTDGQDPAGYEPHVFSSSDSHKRTTTGPSDGTAVNVYGIDTGINIAHECFEGRAEWGENFVAGSPNTDENGHGTHTAGTAVGKGFGLATGAKIFAVKGKHSLFLSIGSGATGNVVSGVNFACEEAKKSGESSVAVMSLGAILVADIIGYFPLIGDSTPLLQAVKTCIDEVGMHFFIAAGNSNLPAGTQSPAVVDSANTIGAIDFNKVKAPFSNWGKRIDLWAYGVNIKSAWIGSPTATNTISGTSMAAPWVAGAAAIVLSNGGKMSPSQLTTTLKDKAVEDVVLPPLSVQDPTAIAAYYATTRKRVQV